MSSLFLSFFHPVFSQCYSLSHYLLLFGHSSLLSPLFLFSSDACAACVTPSLSLSLSSSLLALSIYIPSFSSLPPRPPPLFSWLLNQCLKCVSRVSLAQHLSTATHWLLFQEMSVRVCVCSVSPLLPHTNTHPSICPISTCAEAQPPGKLTNENLPQPSVAFLAAFSSFNSTFSSIPQSLTQLHTPPSLFPSCRVNSLFITLNLVWLQLIRQITVLILVKRWKPNMFLCWSQPHFDLRKDTQLSHRAKASVVTVSIIFVERRFVFVCVSEARARMIFYMCICAATSLCQQLAIAVRLFDTYDDQSSSPRAWVGNGNDFWLQAELF